MISISQTNYLKINQIEQPPTKEEVKQAQELINQAWQIAENSQPSDQEEIWQEFDQICTIINQKLSIHNESSN